MFDQTFDGLQDVGVAPMIWSPLAGGRLFGNVDERQQRLQSVIQHIADQHNVSFASVVLAWIMRLPCRPIPLTGSGRIAAIGEAVAATAIEMSRSDWFTILRAARGHEVA
jgi:predicted oxidoreductase